MRIKKFNKINKALVIFLVLCFALSVTAVSASAHDNSNHERYDDGHKNGHEDGYKNGHEDGYKDGHNKGYKDGKKQGKKDCEQYGSRGNLVKVPSPHSKHRETEHYKRNYKDGYIDGYIDSYNQIRYDCLKKGR